MSDDSGGSDEDMLSGEIVTGPTATRPAVTRRRISTSPTLALGAGQPPPDKDQGIEMAGALAREEQGGTRESKAASVPRGKQGLLDSFSSS